MITNVLFVNWLKITDDDFDNVLNDDNDDLIMMVTVPEVSAKIQRFYERDKVLKVGSILVQHFFCSSTILS